jgi:hypothetical protein
MSRRPEDPAFAPLFAMSPNRVTPVLLELARRQAGRRRPPDLLKQFGRDGFVAPAPLDQRTVHRLDGLALAAAAGFEALQLAPVAPLGVCSALAPTSQDRTLSASRGTEVVSDPTNVLALECARRLLAEPANRVRLCTVHQVLRAQALPPQKGFSRHFRLFALAEAGRGQPEDGFEVQAIAGHVQVFDRLFDACGALELAFPGRRATVFVAPGSELLGRRVRQALEAALPHVALREEALASRYYEGIRVLFGAHAASGEFVPLADTGRFDWVARLTANRSMRYVASGIGIQLAPLLFRRAGSGR